jgi:isocitrate/isopropylmalate dehydrogenase
MHHEATLIENAVKKVIGSGILTSDVTRGPAVSTTEFADAVITALVQ